MGSASDVLRIARNELGNTSGKKYWDAYFNGSMSYVNGSQTPYCACFVSWVLSKASVKAAGIPAAYCPYICRDGRNAGKTVSKYSAQPGDIVLFDWDGDGLSDHVGLVETNQGSYLQTIEGNTNGGIVSRRTRYFSGICHIIRPDYSKNSKTSDKSNTSKNDSKLEVDGWAGPLTITALQKAVGLDEYYIDGILSGQYIENREYLGNIWSCGWNGYGSYTVKKLQMLLGIHADGIWGKVTSMALQKHLIGLGYSCGPDGVDGYFGYNSCCALQKALNDGKLFK